MTVGWEKQVWGSVMMLLVKPLNSFEKALPTNFDPQLSEGQQRDLYITTVKEWIWKNCPDANRNFAAKTQEELVKEVTQRAFDGIAQVAIKKELSDPIYRFITIFGEFKKQHSSKPETEAEKRFRMQGELLKQWLKDPALFWTQGKPKDAPSDSRDLTTTEQDDFVIIDDAAPQKQKSKKDT